MTDTEKIQLAEDWYNDPSTTQKEKTLLEKLFPEIKPVYFLEIPAGDVAPAEEDGPLEEDIFPESSESEEQPMDEKIQQYLIQMVNAIRADDLELSGLNKEEVLACLEKQKEQIPYIDFVIKPHKGDDANPYDMSVFEAQEYAIKRGFGIPFNHGEVYVDERHITQTIGNILRWADEHPKEQKPAEKLSKEECVKKFKALCDAYEIKLPNREYDIYGLCEDLHKLFGDIQKPAEWSEEDEKCIKDIVNCLKYLEMEDTERQYNGDRNVNPKRYANMIAKLKSLRPQFHWKPSERQLGALLTALGDEKKTGSDVATDLRNLHYDLKKYFKL